MTDEQKQIIVEIDAIAKAKTVETWEGRWLQYMMANQAKRKALLDFRLPKERNKETLAILGPGASITQFADRLPELREVATICCLPSALQWVMRQGIEPDFVVLQDSNHDAKFFVEGDYPLLCPTTVHPDIVKQRDPYLFTLLLGNGQYDDPVFGLWNLRALLMDCDLQYGVVSLGCVTNLAIEIIDLFMKREILNAKHIVLFGQDFGGWNGLARVPRNDETVPPSIESHKGKLGDWVEWNGFATDARMIWYKFKLLSLWHATCSPLYSCSFGMLHELPHVGFEQVVRGKWPKRYPSKKRIEKMFTEFAEVMADTFPREE